MERVPFLVHLTRKHGTQAVFLSYDTLDSALLQTLKDALAQENIATQSWLNAMHIRDSLPGQIENMLGGSDIVVVLWTENSIHATDVLGEAEAAMQPGRFKLLNWFHSAVPSPNPEKQTNRERSGMSTPERDEEGRLYTDILLPFRDAVGRSDLDGVVRFLKANLKSLPGCEEGASA